jgi:hypothetical protein
VPPEAAEVTAERLVRMAVKVELVAQEALAVVAGIFNPLTTRFPIP